MAKNYLIGIGGTGARVIESVVHCCAAGFGPPELSVFLVDPDEGNGNLSRTTSLLTRYKRCRDAVKGAGNPDVTLFGTDITTPDPMVWSIFSDQNMTLGTYINHGNVKKSRPELAQFMEVLFSEAELTTQLNEGFRGHPSIGAVVMANAPDDVEPWRSLWADVDTAAEGEVRVFLVGSIFGGTGAAGVPTFGAPSMLKEHERARLNRAERRPASEEGDDARREPVKSKIFLGAALVLPYFSIDLSKLATSDDAMFVTPADFPIATKAALQYYDEKDLAGMLAFDQVYLLGDSLAQPVGAFSPGNKAQDNRPHYVELATALSAFDFFRQNPTSDAVRQGQRFFAASREGDHVDWRALPVTRDAALSERLHTEFERRVAAMTVFAYAFNTLGLETLGHGHRDIHDAWYRSHFTFDPRRPEDADKDPRKAQASVDAVAAFARDFLTWVTSLDERGDRVRLVDRAQVFGDAVGQEPPALRDRQRFAPALGAVLKGAPSKQRDFAAFLGHLNTVRLTDASMSAVRRYVHLFYEASLKFVADNWRLERPSA